MPLVNVGGRVFQASEDLLRHCGKLLVRVFDGPIPEGRVFLDRDLDLFEWVLRFARTGEISKDFPGALQAEFDYLLLDWPDACARCKVRFDSSCNTDTACRHHRFPWMEVSKSCEVMRHVVLAASGGLGGLHKGENLAAHGLSVPSVPTRGPARIVAQRIVADKCSGRTPPQVLGGTAFVLVALLSPVAPALKPVQAEEAQVVQTKEERKAEQERIRQEAIAKRKEEEQQAEAKRKEAEEKRKAEAEAKRKEAEEKRKEDEEKRKAAEEERKAAEAKKKEEAEKAQAEKARAQAEAQKKAAEEERKAEEAKKKAEEEAKKKEAEAKKKKEEDKEKAKISKLPDVVLAQSSEARIQAKAKFDKALQTIKQKAKQAEDKDREMIGNIQNLDGKIKSTKDAYDKAKGSEKDAKLKDQALLPSASTCSMNLKLTQEEPRA
eukprot:g17462.t1